MLLYRFRDRWLEWVLAFLIVLAYASMVYLCFNPFNPLATVAAAGPVDTSIKALQLSAEEVKALKSLGDSAAAEYIKTAKTAPDATTLSNIRFEAIYNSLVDTKLKEVMPEILISDKTVTDLVKSGEYDKMTQKLKLEKSGVVKVYESQEQFKGKVGDTFRDEKVLEISTITDKDKQEDARGFLVSVQALREIEKVARGI